MNIAAEWSRTTADIGTRRARLFGAQAGGYNVSAVLTDATVPDDGEADELFGGGDDRFVVHVGPVPDPIGDPDPADTTTNSGPGGGSMLRGTAAPSAGSA